MIAENSDGRTASRSFGSASEAIAACRAGLALDPGDARLRLELGVALAALGRFDEAIAELEQSCALAPEQAIAHYELGAACHQAGRLEAAIEAMARAHDLAPDHVVLHSNLLFLLNYSAQLTGAELRARHARFGERHVQPVAAPAPDMAWPRRLRVGYVSPDFRSHVVSSFMLPVFARHDRRRFEVVAYYSYPQADQVTAAMRALADDWVDCARMSDAELVARIRADRIDILVDLAGHAMHHRLTAFAARAAPLQLTYLGYPNTTGLTAIDARLVDAVTDPPGEADRHCVERLVRLPRCFLCYRPGPDILEPGAPPAQVAGQVTFGSFNNFQKLSDAFFDAAARILAAVPGSRLLLKAKVLDLPSAAQRVRARFARAGIEPARLELLGWAPTPESHLAAYRQVDIALDSFPYNGTTTTCEALWMGVPVVALRGERHAGRVGASLLGAVGLEELVAPDLDGYVRIAAQLAGDAPRLATLRAGMRARLRSSALRDEAGFVGMLEESYLSLWREKLEPAPAPTATLAAARALRGAGRLAEARDACAQILRAQPAQADVLRLYWDLCHDLADNAPAVDAIGRALAAGGAPAPLQYMLGCAMEDLRRPQEAASAYRRALEADPAHARAANNLGCLLEAAGDLDGAEASYERALGADPALANAHYNRANLLRRRGRVDEAERGLRAALALAPGQADWHSALGEILLLGWRLDESIDCQRAALKLDPGSARAQFGLANALMMLGRADEAETGFRRVLELEPDFPEAHGNLLLCLHYRRGDDGAALHAEHRAWAARHAAGLYPPAARAAHARLDRAPDRRLNVGYYSPNLHRHSVASFFEPLLAAHDRSRVRVVCYSGVERADAVTGRLQSMSDGWCDLRGLSADAAARRIRDDRIDILVDLAGHTGGGRPLLFARKPAPVQLSWLGYPDTTGLEQMDYRLTDAEADPPGAERWYSERLIRLPRSFLCFAPDAGSPEPGPLPARGRAQVTFGCFNNLAKLTPDTIRRWARLLAEVPGARLMLKAHALGAGSARRGVLGALCREGVAADRVTLLGPEDSAAGHLARYRDVDIALDTYPYNGTTTTCEALWMGVPVVTLAGPTHVSRVGASILACIGLRELVAASGEDYIDRAAALARDLPRLAALREGMRARMRAAPLLDAAGFARAVESAYRIAWQSWCASNAEVEAIS
jgi:predicted O-linked N-acetylglucosamine transferase (SPINDLY family)